jgi:hypothetical protein
MRKKKKNIFAVTRHLISAALAAAAILAMVACAPVLDPGGAPPAGQGTVSISLGVDGAGPSAGSARTLLPGAVTTGVFDAYTLVFTPQGGNGTSVTLDVTSLTVNLDAGDYTLTLTAKKGGAEAATGEAGSFSVTSGENTAVEVQLVFKPEAGDGILSYSVTRPSGLGLADAQFTLTPLHQNGITYGNDWLWDLYNVKDGQIAVTHTGNPPVASGYYEAVVTLTAGERQAVKSDIVHIGAGQTTTLNWTFDESDFSTTVTDMWVLGNGNQWETYNDGNKLNQQADGAFVWEGEMTSAYFRFSLENTGSWAGDKDKPNRFQPVDNIAITLNGPVDMAFVPRNTGTGTAWGLGGNGYYRFEVDPYAKTVTVTMPVIVTDVAIKDVGQNAEVTEISLEQGMANYEFAAVVSGHNVGSTGVTWAISGTVASGTSIIDGKLTIDAAEPVKPGAFTITATSTVDPQKSASVTVNVTAQGIPKLAAPVNVVLSNTGEATWNESTDNAHAVRYTVRLYKDTSTQIHSEDVATVGPYSVNFLSKMRESGVGSYTVKVKAAGDGTSYNDSNDVTSAEQFIEKRDPPPYVWWIDNTIAHWDLVSGITSPTDYAVKVYNNGNLVDTTTGTAAYDENKKAYVQLSGIMQAHGPGSYTFSVTTKGDGVLILDSDSNTVNTPYSYAATLSAPSGLSLSAGSVTWTPVAEASSYTVNLYKDGALVGTYTRASSPLNALGDMRNHGAGTYTVSVSAIGDDINWLSSPESAASSPEVVAVLDTPGNLAWNGDSAQWDAVTGATGYSAQLYKDGSPLGAAVSSGAVTCNFSGQMTDVGFYTFTVQATSAGLYLDGTVSAVSPAKQVGGTAAITLEASEKWSGTLDVTGGNPASIPKSNGSLTITVSGSSFTTFVWIVDGAPLGGETGASITLTGTNYSLGGHSVTVYATKNGIPWSPQAPVTFTVTAN